jgi:hypothetical protein
LDLCSNIYALPTPFLTNYRKIGDAPGVLVPPFSLEKRRNSRHKGSGVEELRTGSLFISAIEYDVKLKKTVKSLLL